MRRSKKVTANLPKWPFLLMVLLVLGACKEPESTPPVQRPVAADANDAAPAKTTAVSLRRLEAAQAAAEMKPSAWCNLEAVGGQAFAGEDLQVDQGSLKVSGWIADEASRALPQGPALRIESTRDKTAVWEAPIGLGIKRDDVASAMSAPAIADAGFVQELVLHGLSPGRYHLYLVYVARDGVTSCDNGRHIYVRR